jgi:hypothetical protein
VHGEPAISVMPEDTLEQLEWVVEIVLEIVRGTIP